MSTKTGSGGKVVLYGVVAVLLIATGWAAWGKIKQPARINGEVMVQENEEYIELRADWTPQRRLDVNWQIGAALFSDSFNNEDEGHWSEEQGIARGTEVVILVEQHEPGSLSCEIWQNEEQVVLDEVTGTTRCRVTWVVG